MLEKTLAKFIYMQKELNMKLLTYHFFLQLQG